VNASDIVLGTYEDERRWIASEDKKQLASFRSEPPAFLLVPAKPRKARAA
jgi:hypothetical protein